VTDNKKFIADVEAFKNKTIEQMLRVAKQSIQDTIEIAQTPVAQGGDMPVKDGFLRNSLVTTAKAGDLEGPNSYILGLSTLELGDPFSVAWTASYAIPRHYAVGVGQGGGLWRTKAAQRWEGVVQANARKVQ
jgi:hypothetical protein